MSSHTEELWYNETVCLEVTVCVYIYIYIYIYIHTYTHTSPLALWVECLSMPQQTKRLKKMVFDTSLLNSQHWKVHIKDKVEQSRDVVAIEKGAFGSPSTMVINFTFYFIYMHQDWEADMKRLNIQDDFKKMLTPLRDYLYDIISNSLHIFTISVIGISHMELKERKKINIYIGVSSLEK